MSGTQIVFGGYQKPASIHNRAAARFGEELERRLGQRVSFRLIGSVLDELGRNSGELTDMVASGELAFCYMSTVRFSPSAPELGILELPFVVGSREAAYRTLDGPFGARVRGRLLEYSPFRVLGYWDNGFRHLSNSVRPIRRPEDCRGIVIRTQMSPLHGEAFRALGFEPCAVDIKAFTETIATGVLQAQDNPLTNIYNFGVHRHQRYITLTGHFFGASCLVCRERTYRSWPDDVREAVDVTAASATAYQRQLAAAEDREMLGKFSREDVEIIELSADERAAFVGALKPVLDRHRSAYAPDLFAALAGA